MKVDLDTDTQEFVFNWLKNNLMISGLKLSLSDDPDFAALEEKLVQVESEKDNLILEVTAALGVEHINANHSIRLLTGVGMRCPLLKDCA